MELLWNLGLVDPMMLTGKLLFQEETRRKIHWNKVIARNVKNRWDEWIGSLKGIEKLKLPRCLEALEHNDATVNFNISLMPVSRLTRPVAICDVLTKRELYPQSW